MIFLLLVSPQINPPLIDKYISEGYPVNFSCVASGDPTPTFVWTFNDDDLPSGIKQNDQEGESTLELPPVTKEMEGTYKCTAINKENKASSSATLYIYGKFNKKINVVISMKINVKMKILEIKGEMRIKMKVKVMVRKGENRSSRVTHIYCLRNVHSFNYELMSTNKETKKWNRYSSD